MGRLLLQIILAAYLSMTVSRSVFSAYVVAGVDCMEDGSYE